MANDFSAGLTQLVGLTALPHIMDGVVMSGPKNLVNRTFEGYWDKHEDFVIGTEVKVLLPNYYDTPKDFEKTGVTVETDVVRRNTKIVIEAHPYHRIGLGSLDQTFNVKNFIATQAIPIMHSFALFIENYIFTKMAKAAYQYVDLGGRAPSSVADLSKLLTKFNLLNIRDEDRNVVMTTEDYGVMIQVENIVKANERGNSYTPDTGYIGRFFGIDFYWSNVLSKLVLNKTTFSGGKINGTVVANQNIKAISIDGATNGEVITAGTILKAGDATFTANTDVTVANGQAQVLVDTVAYSIADNTDVTVVTTGKNFGFSRNAFALVMIAPDLPLSSSIDSYVATDPETGCSVRVTISFGLDNLKNSIVFDTFIGGAVIRPEWIFRF